MERAVALLEPPLLAAPSTPQFMEGMGPVLGKYQAGDKAGAVNGFLQAVAGPDYRNFLDRAVPGGYEQAVADADTLPAVSHPLQMQNPQDMAKALADFFSHHPLR